MCASCWERILIEFVDDDPPGPRELPFDGPPGIVLVQEWPRLAAALVAASPELVFDVRIVQFCAALRILLLNQSQTDAALRECRALAKELIESGQAAPRATVRSGRGPEDAELLERLMRPDTYGTAATWRECLGDPRMLRATRELLEWFCDTAEYREYHPLRALDVVALNFALAWQVRHDTDQELLLWIVGLPLDPFHDALGYGAWLQRLAIVALHGHFGLPAVQKGARRIRPALIGYLAARAQLDRRAR